MQKRTIVYCFFNSKLENTDFLFISIFFSFSCMYCALGAICPMLGIGGAVGKRTSPNLTLVEFTLEFLNIQSSISFLTRKIHQVAVLSIQMFSIIPQHFLSENFNYELYPHIIICLHL